uniref:ABC transporter permease n=1 Tax=Rhizobium sp. RCAM05350 TaxID=2895568 RepID=UPI0020768651|nr:ABC transporter permease [Rhizobium sp. RCAM05350]
MRNYWILLKKDRLACAAFLYLLVLVAIAIVGPAFVDPALNRMQLTARHAAPFDLNRSWVYFLGGDALGRPMIVRLAVAARTTIMIASTAVLLAMVTGTIIGLVAGLRENLLSAALMRGIDVLLSIPSLLLAMVVLFVLGAHIGNVILILTITRLAVFARTVRGESLELRERWFVAAARIMGAGDLHVLRHHIVPLVMPTVLAIAALEFAVIMLAESTLSFLGIGVQPPDATWGLLVAEGQPYLRSAWWVSLWPGLAIASMAVSATIVGNWFRIANDPTLRVRLTSGEVTA